MRRNDDPDINRQQAMDAKPVAVEIARREPLAGGGQRVGVYVPTGGLSKRLLRLPDRVIRQFDLDAYGVELLSLCDGKRTVRNLIKHFARSRRLDPHEAENAVTTFLRTLISKGLVRIVVSAQAGLGRPKR